MTHTKKLLSIMATALIALAFTACGAEPNNDLSAEPTQTREAKLQYTDSEGNFFGLTGVIEAYLNQPDDVGTGCNIDDDVTGQTPVASENVEYDEVVGIEAFGLEDGEYCFYVVDPGYLLYYDSNDNDEPDAPADSDQVKITDNPAGPVTITGGAPAPDSVTFMVEWDEELNAD